jgi:hypothetical protein
MDVFGFITLFITGFTSCAEFGSYAFVHPVIRNLPQQHHIFVEKGLLKTFGRVMPVLMTLCVVLSISYAVKMNKTEGAANIFFWASAVSFIVALASTIAVNVGINSATGKWNIDSPPNNWKEIRNRWELFQAIRSWFLLIGFMLLCIAVTLY